MIELVDPTIAIEWVHPFDRLKPRPEKMSAEEYEKTIRAKHNPTVLGILPMTEGVNRVMRAAITEGQEFKNDNERVRHIMVETFLRQVQYIRNVSIPGVQVSATEFKAGGKPEVVLKDNAHKLRFLDVLPIDYWPDIFEAINSYTALKAGQLGN